MWGNGSGHDKCGSQPGNQPGIYDRVLKLLEDAFFWSKSLGKLGGPGQG